jgi:hypothetical protein
MGYQLYNSRIICDIKTKQERFELNAPLDVYEYATENSIWADAIAEVCVPIINYLNNQSTDFKKDKGKHWSYEQLGFLIELLILIGYYIPKSSRKYMFVRSKPNNQDKNYLNQTLLNKIKLSKRQTINTIDI